MNTWNRRQHVLVHAVTVKPTSFQGSVSSDVKKNNVYWERVE